MTFNFFFFLKQVLSESYFKFSVSEPEKELVAEIDKLKKEQLTLTDELAMTIRFCSEINFLLLNFSSLTISEPGFQLMLCKNLQFFWITVGNLLLLLL